MKFCGIRVYGSGANLDSEADYGIGVSIDVDDAGNPYVVNRLGEVFHKGDEWTKLDHTVPMSQVAVSQSNS